MYNSYRRELDAMTSKPRVPLKIVLLLGSTRNGRQGLRVSKFIKKQLEDATHSVEVIDPLDVPFPLLAQPLHHYPDQSQAPTWLQEAGNKIRDADAIVVVSAEYNHCVPPALSNIVDHFPPSFFGYKPSGIVCYSMGPYGGTVAATQLRCLLGIVGCISISNLFTIPVVHEALDPDGTPINARLVPHAKNFIGELEWYAWAMKARRDEHGVPTSSV